MAKAIWIAPLLLLAAAPTIQQRSPETILWAAPSILFAAMVIAWAAESAQFFIAQGVALAILAWMQTLPEFAVEAVLAWQQQLPYLFANLTGALRLLTGLGWPMIYCAAALVHRRREGTPLRRISLEGEHSVQVVGLLPGLVWVGMVVLKTIAQPVRLRDSDRHLRRLSDRAAAKCRRRKKKVSKNWSASPAPSFCRRADGASP